MFIETSDLEGAALDWAVAHCHPDITEIITIGGFVWVDGLRPSRVWPGTTEAVLWCPRTDWAQGGPLIEARNFVIGRSAKDYPAWHAKTDGKIYGGENSGEGPTPLIAAMRAIVAAELGDEVDVPEELGGGHD